MREEGNEGLVDEQRPTRRRLGLELALLAFFAVAAVAHTWPLAVTLDQATAIRGDYFNNAWNAWWVTHSLAEGHSPWWTDHLYYPLGLSLKRHTLSPLNALARAGLGMFLGTHESFNVMLLAKLALAGWTFSLLARHVTRSLAGSVLAGLLWAFNPFHFYYVAQVNVFTFELVPLALLFWLRTWRLGGWRNALAAALATAAVGAATLYYVVYLVLIVGLLLVAGRLAERGVPWRVGARRLLLAALPTGLLVGLATLPFLVGSLGAEASAEGAGAFSLQGRRANDLLGYHWVGGPEVLVVSWPTMLGYGTLALLALFALRLVRRQPFWVLVGALFFVLSLGESLQVAGEETGWTLPYGMLADVPVLSMLRKPDRCFFGIQLAVALLAAEAWTGLAARLRSPAVRGSVWAAVALLVSAELTPAPLRRFDYEPPTALAEIARDSTVASLIEMPPMPVDVQNARYLLHQTVHGKKAPLGYSTSLATDESHNRQYQTIVNGYWEWTQNRRGWLGRWIRRTGIDLVVHHKRVPFERPANAELHGRVVFAPFFFVRRGLIGMRQTGQYVDARIDRLHLARVGYFLSQEFGEPVHEDDDVVVFRVEKGRG